MIQERFRKVKNYLEYTGASGYIFKMRVMGLDLGTKTIGVAISDEARRIAQPLVTIKRTSLSKDLGALKAIMEENSVTSIVVGLPVNMDGTYGPRAQSALKFMEKLKEEFGCEVSPWDERLSTMAVNRLLIEGDVSRAKRKGVVDKMAASYILQGYLDSLAKARED